MSPAANVAYREGSWPGAYGPLSYRLWSPPSPSALLIIVHGFGEHGGRYAPIAEVLALSNFCVAVPDLWGHGRSAGRRGDVKRFADYLHALRGVTDEVFLPASSQRSYAVYGHSFGGLVAIHWGMVHPPALRRLVIQSPLLKVAFPIRWWKKAAAAGLACGWPTAQLPMALDLTMLTHDRLVVEAYRQDPLVHRVMSARAYRAIQQASDEAFEGAATLDVPTLMLCGAADQIVSVPAAKSWFGRLRCEKRQVTFPATYHELHHEPIRDQVITRVGEWALMLFLAFSLFVGGPRVTAQSTTTQQDPDWPAVISQLRDVVYHSDNPGARRQLATAYNNYGVSLGNQQQWELAVQQLQEALRLDPANAQFKTNLSHIYLNQAHEAYARHQAVEAREPLQQAIALTPDFAPAYTLLGEVEYHTQRLKEAKAAWQRALELDPSQAGLAERLKQVTDELPVESKFERLWQAYFDLRYEEQLQRPVGFDIRDALLEARRLVGSDFSYWPKQKIVVLIYSAQSFRALRQQTPDWVAGQFDGKIRVPFPDHQMDSATVKQILFHEYTHALIHDLTNDRCPTWLNEGLAEYEGRKQQAAPLTYLANAHAGHALIPWDQLSEHFSNTASAESVALAYQESHSAVAYLIERYGLWRIRRLLKAMADGQPWQEALSGEFHTTVARLETSWRDWLPEFLGKGST